MDRKVKALSLFSGGLDSTLAIMLIIEQGIEVAAVHFSTPFCTCKGQACSDPARAYGFELKKIAIGDDFLRILEDPPHGYGKNLNPCIDCRILMLRRAKEMMDEFGASFLITGDVVGQRPMSQNKKALAEIEKSSGVEGILLRPLSARILPMTIPEKKGWVDRARLYGISGRSRKVQFQLAERFGVKNFPQPAGGCLLTDPIYSRKVKDLIDHKILNTDNITLLKIGRHFRIGEQSRLIVGRNKEENEQLPHLTKSGDLVLTVSSIPGPTAILRGIANREILKIATGIVARYSDHSNRSVKIEIKE
ncbi:MAG TPA: DUF814 domain-containing protein, partial [bacterium (Candidatus Stahlbacteria)]|nr:DUF814 domain-containing protein [Candidatus Stahlbacteria bacterium]